MTRELSQLSPQPKSKTMAHQQKTLPPLTAVRGDIPPEVEELCWRMVAKKPADRFQSIKEVIAALDAIPRGDTTAGLPSIAFGGGAVSPGLTGRLIAPRAAGSGQPSNSRHFSATLSKWSQIPASCRRRFKWSGLVRRGHVSAGDYRQVVFPLLFFKRLSDVYDEEFSAALAESDSDEAYAAFPEQHRFVIPSVAHWRDVRAVTKNVGKAIRDAIHAVQAANPGKLEGIFGDAPWTNRDRLPDEMLENLIEHFSTRLLDRNAVPEDELGNAYEFLIK